MASINHDFANFRPPLFLFLSLLWLLAGADNTVAGLRTNRRPLSREASVADVVPAACSGAVLNPYCSFLHHLSWAPRCATANCQETSDAPTQREPRDALDRARHSATPLRPVGSGFLADWEFSAALHAVEAAAEEKGARWSPQAVLPPPSRVHLLPFNGFVRGHGRSRPPLFLDATLSPASLLSSDFASFSSLATTQLHRIPPFLSAGQAQRVGDDSPSLAHGVAAFCPASSSSRRQKQRMPPWRASALDLFPSAAGWKGSERRQKGPSGARPLGLRSAFLHSRDAADACGAAALPSLFLASASSSRRYLLPSRRITHGAFGVDGRVFCSRLWEEARARGAARATLEQTAGRASPDSLDSSVASPSPSALSLAISPFTSASAARPNRHRSAEGLPCARRAEKRRRNARGVGGREGRQPSGKPTASGAAPAGTRRCRADAEGLANAADAACGDEEGHNRSPRRPCFLAWRGDSPPDAGRRLRSGRRRAELRAEETEEAATAGGVQQTEGEDKDGEEGDEEDDGDEDASWRDGDFAAPLAGGERSPEDERERAAALTRLREARRRDPETPREKTDADGASPAWSRPAPWIRRPRGGRRAELQLADEADAWEEDEADDAETETAEERGYGLDTPRALEQSDGEARRGGGSDRESRALEGDRQLSSPRPSPQQLIRRDDTFPRICLLGRPNVGKSTLFNRLKDRDDAASDAIVRDEEGTTRDRHYAFSLWRGRPFVVVDTGGLIFEEDRYAAALYADEIRTQVQLALQEAACAIFVVDGRHGLDGEDEVTAEFLRRSGKPAVVCVNKSENYRSGRAAAQEFWKLGLGEPFPCSAVEGVGVADLLDACFRHVPPLEASSQRLTRGDTIRTAEGTAEPNSATARGDRARTRQGRWRGLEEALGGSSFAREDVSVAIIGRPNVGKSQLLNRLLGFTRSLVSAEAGTTRDAVDELVKRDSLVYRLIDTAGIRRARVVKAQKGTEFVMVKRAERALARCDVCLLVCDAERGLVKQDVLLAKKIAEEGRAAVIVMNKWDTVDTAATSHQEVDTYIRSVFYPLRWASIVYVSAKTGKNAARIWAAVNEAVQQHRRRLGTGLLNFVLRDALAVHPPPLMKGRKRGKIYVAQQASTQPPTIVVFCNKADYFPEVYRLYLDYSMRTAFNFHHTPITWIFREKRRRQLEKVSRSRAT